jgi:hypothetical protein
VLIDQPGFGMGRSGRFDITENKPTNLAPTYAYLALSDEVMRRASTTLGRPIDRQGVAIQAEAVQASPVFVVTVDGKDPAEIEKVAGAVAAAVESYVKEQQTANRIPRSERLTVAAFGAPSHAEALTSRDTEVAAVLFLIPLFLATGLALVAENVSRNRSAGAGEAVPPEARAPSDTFGETPLRAEDLRLDAPTR